MGFKSSCYLTCFLVKVSFELSHQSKFQFLQMVQVQRMRDYNFHFGHFLWIQCWYDVRPQVIPEIKSEQIQCYRKVMIQAGSWR